MEIRKRRSAEQMNLDLGRAASVVKLVCGVANNATWLVMLDAHDQIKKHPRYRHEVKRHYKMALDLFRKQERNLLYASQNRLFHVADLTPDARKQYGNITDAQYFEFWQGLGSRAYSQEHKWISSLANKYRLSLLNHRIPHAEILSQAMVAQACLELSCTLYESALENCAKDYAIPMEVLDGIFSPLDLTPISILWKKALNLTEPQTMTIQLNSVEDSNIAHGIRQLYESWSNPSLIYRSALTATQDFEEVFRTKGENKKKIREIEQICAEAETLLATNHA